MTYDCHVIDDAASTIHNCMDVLFFLASVFKDSKFSWEEQIMGTTNTSTISHGKSALKS